MKRPAHQWLPAIPMFIFLAFPSSATYVLKTYEFGGGGGTGVTSSTYSMESITGEVSLSQLTSTTYQDNTGLVFAQEANTPAAPTFVNNSGTDTTQLKITLDNGSNPTDATFIITISTDNFASNLNYVQADGTVASTAVSQSYTAWGGASGMFVVGLSSGTTYYVKVKASQGKYTEGPYSSVSSAATAGGATLTFEIDVAPTDQSTSPPYTTSFDLNPGSVSTDSDKIWISIATSAAGGGLVYVKDANAGLTSAVTGQTISSATANLTSATSGYGLQGNTKAQTSGGPLAYVAPFDGTSNNVGGLTKDFKKLFDTSSASIVGGRGSMSILAKASTTTASATDYTDTLTLVAAGAF